MSRIRGRDTQCEVMFRSFAWSKGVRGYRAGGKVPGKPDMYFSRLRLAVFVDGCFWHRCPRCFIKPQNNKIFWERKIASNVRRDKEISRALKKSGVTVLRIWEHEVRQNPSRCYSKLNALLKRLESRR